MSVLCSKLWLFISVSEWHGTFSDFVAGIVDVSRIAPHTRPITGMAGLAALLVAARLKSKGAHSHIWSVEEQAQYLSEERRNEELYVRASAGDHECVGVLLRAGARPEAYTGDTGLVALLSAAKEGHARVAETLLGSRCMELHVDHLSKLSSEPLIMNTALIIVAIRGHTSVIRRGRWPS